MKEEKFKETAHGREEIIGIQAKSLKKARRVKEGTEEGREETEEGRKRQPKEILEELKEKSDYDIV